MKTKALLFALLALQMLDGAWAQGEDETRTARYQSTYNWQMHPTFRSAYQSANSLSSGRDSMFTFSLTAHWGARVWPGGEVYFNPEIASGVPFTQSLVGLGGFTNGEITRAAGTSPQLYRQRLFLRQTWNQGGGSETLASGFNQMAQTVDLNRTVLTIGNFSTLDVFDGNAYAKDPRSQFMNWGNWTYAAWDYAADARGFGWGLALEVYRDDWVFRWGRMTGPKEPNGLAVDFRLLQHYGDQVEVERSHEIGGRPGKLRLLAFHNRAVLAAFNDASAYLINNNPADRQSILMVRNGPKTNQGLGLNIEQELADDVGFFFRGMHAAGATETYAFTEVDRSVSTGFQLKGNRWGRPADRVGVAVLQNRLSPERRRYLELGGLSFFIGDGRLDYKPETIIEGYYNWAMMPGLWLSGGYQKIRNPAYNSSRGPVNVFAARLHAEF